MLHLLPMRLSHLHLEHFRNYTRLDFDFPKEPIVILSGENAQGKTSFLEAIYLLALTKSFRTSDRDFLRQFEQDYYRIEAKIHQAPSKSSNDGNFTSLELCELHVPSHQRVLKKNGVKISSAKFIGHLRAVLFRPEDLMMLTGEPSLRRRYLNSILIQTVPGYMKQLQLYQKLLQQRNALLLQAKLKALSTSALHAQLDLWDTQLAEAGSALMTSRQAYTDFVQDQLQEAESQFEITYMSPFDEIDKKRGSHPDFCPGRTETTNFSFDKETQLLLLESLISTRPLDLRSTHTAVGPHRDDVLLTIKKSENGQSKRHSHHHPLSATASRGELRTALMQLKKAEIAWMQEKTGDIPIILLDDIFSELDTTRKNDFMQLIPENAQTIITLAEGNPLPDTPSLRSAATVRRIHAGKLLDASSFIVQR